MRYSRQNGLYVPMAGPLVLPRFGPTGPASPYRPRPAAAGGGGGCNTTRTNFTGADFFFEPLYDSASVYVAFKFVSDYTGDFCAVDLRLSKTASPTYTLEFGIYAHDGVGDQPSTQIGDWSDTLDTATLTGSPAIYKIGGFTSTSSSGSTYWGVCRVSGVDATNFPNLHFIDSALTKGIVRDGDGAGTWTSAWDFKAYYQFYSA